MYDEPIIKKRPKRTARAQQQLNLFIFSLVIIALIFAVSAYFLWPKEEEFILTDYRVGIVEPRDFIRVVTTEGTITPGVIREVKAPCIGELVEVRVKAGEDVTANQSLGIMVSSGLEVELDKATRDLTNAQAEATRIELENQVSIRKLQVDLNEAEEKMNLLTSELDMWEALYQLGDISKVTLDSKIKEVESVTRQYEDLSLLHDASIEKFEFELANSLHKVETLQKTVDDLLKTKEALNVRSPITGRVLSVAQGSNFTKDSVIFTIADLTTSYLVAKVPVSALSNLQVKQPATIRFMNNNYPGMLSYISPQASSSSEVDIEITFTHLPENPVPNSVALVDIEIGRRNDSPGLPRDYYLTTGDSMYLFVVDEQKSVARKMPAKFGIIEGNWVEILSGVELGDKVIISSYEGFKHLEEVKLGNKE